MNHPRRRQESIPGLDRRAFLRGAAALPLLGLPSGGRVGAQEPADPPFPGMILRVREPENLEFPFPTLDRFISPTERFYVRNHFPLPKLDMPKWRLKVEGQVERPLELSQDDLRRLP